MKKWASLGLATGLLFGATSACSDEPYDPNNSTEAEAQCKGFVNKRLKAPDSAEYNLVAVQDGDGWTVVGTVDSQNSFGAMLRSSVRCELHFEGDRAHLDDISID